MDQAEIGAGVDGLGHIELLGQRSNCFITSVTAEVVQADGQHAGRVIRNKVGCQGLAHLRTPVQNWTISATKSAAVRTVAS